MKGEKSLDYLQLMKKMVDVVAHDVRNPLNNIVLSTAQFKLGTPPDKEDMAFFIDIIERNCDRINALLAELAAVLHQQGLNPGRFDITELVRELAEEREDRLQLGRISLVARLGEGIFAHFDREKMKAALDQLLENAIDALPGGGLIEISVKEQNSIVHIRVQDSGPGIEPHILPHIFAPFFTTKERHRGLGLTLVKNIADAHHATIGLPEQGQPTCFTVMLPHRMQE